MHKEIYKIHRKRLIDALACDDLGLAESIRRKIREIRRTAVDNS